jgi:hypothetical protein
VASEQKTTPSRPVCRTTTEPVLEPGEMQTRDELKAWVRREHRLAARVRQEAP